MADDIKIREATASDVPRIVEMGKNFLMNGPYRDQLGNPDDATKFCFSMLVNTKAKIIVSESDGHVTGVFAFIVFPHYFSGELTSGEMIWYVDPECRKGGAALKLLAEAEKLSRALGSKRMQLTAPSEEVGSLYRFCGGYKKIEVCYQRSL
jgi:L-amino acid N-acyltransferase YncA